MKENRRISNVEPQNIEGRNSIFFYGYYFLSFLAVLMLVTKIAINSFVS